MTQRSFGKLLMIASGLILLISLNHFCCVWRDEVKLIFLDIDGVLVNRDSFRLPRTAHGGYKATFCTAHPSCVEQLNRIVEATGARVVLSSVWRLHGVRVMREVFAKWGVNAKIVGRTPDLRSTAETILTVQRGDEINAWLSKREGVDRFVIIDDDADMNGLSDRLVQTQFEPGLTVADADRVIAMLNDAELRDEKKGK